MDDSAPRSQAAMRRRSLAWELRKGVECPSLQMPSEHRWLAPLWSPSRFATGNRVRILVNPLGAGVILTHAPAVDASAIPHLRPGSGGDRGGCRPG
jgi:hypothetical protein